MSLQIDQFDYKLPTKFIAQRPVSPRDSSKLLVINRQDKSINSSIFSNLPQILPKNSILVRNNTKVIPARIIGQKSTGGKIELLLLKRQTINNSGEIWQCLSKPGIKLNQTISFASNLEAKCIQIDGYTRLIKFNQSKQELLVSLNEIGQTPTPPYIEWNKKDENELRNKYQTIYAKIKGSAAAPTAGLHFTPELNQQLISLGIQIEEVTLHVGLGTFQPVKEKNVKNHKMHSEWFELTADIAKKLNQAKKNKQPIISVGTTTTRVLESCCNKQGELEPYVGETDIFIMPGYKFKFIDTLITNFHLPKSTLLMLVSAFCSHPNTTDRFISFENNIIGKAYQKAMKNNYRFYSFGDAMLIV